MLVFEIFTSTLCKASLNCFCTKCLKISKETYKFVKLHIKEIRLVTYIIILTRRNFKPAHRDFNICIEDSFEKILKRFEN